MSNLLMGELVQIFWVLQYTCIVFVGYILCVIRVPSVIVTLKSRPHSTSLFASNYLSGDRAALCTLVKQIANACSTILNLVECHYLYFLHTTDLSHLIDHISYSMQVPESASSVGLTKNGFVNKDPWHFRGKVFIGTYPPTIAVQ